MKIPESGRMFENGASCLPSTSTCNPQEEKQVIAELTARAESDLREGNLYYVVSMRWYACWQNYVGEDVSSCSSTGQTVGLPKMHCRPGPIDNSELVLNVKGSDKDDPEIIETLEEERDYVLVPAEVWNKLLGWYKGGPSLPRKLICQGATYKQFSVEVYPLRLKLIDAKDNSQTIVRLSKKASLHELYEKVARCKEVELDKVRIWDFFNKTKGQELLPSDQTLEESNLLMDQDVLLDLNDSVHLSTGKELILVPIEPSRLSTTIAGGPAFSNGHSASYVSNQHSGSKLTSGLSSKDDGYDRFGVAVTHERKGLAGLQNLGNTCFMNSALQCLVHTPSLVNYFVQDYSDEINKNNLLGMGGELALAFGDLLSSMWSTGRTTVAPRQFKGKVARFAPQFSGYNQHDSQEFLAFLLDGLHEDLNRVKQKPYIEMKDSDGRPDAVYADECWKNHKARNDSIIVDTFQGQYKSTLVCPVCSKISITFDPFMYLTLPLPSMVNRTMTVTVFYSDGSGLPMPYTVLVPKHGCTRDLSRALTTTTACCLRNDENLLLAEVYAHKIHRYLEVPLEPLSSIKDDDYIVAYRVSQKHPGLKRIEILHQPAEMSGNLKVHNGKLLGTPLVTFIGEDNPTTLTIESAICRVLSPLRKTTYFGLGKAKEFGCDLEGSDQAMPTCSYEEDEEECRLKEDAGEAERAFSFQLMLVDQRGSFKTQIEEDCAMKDCQVIGVMLNWTNNLFQSYDISYLEDLPEVCKSGFTAKKTRQETISLFSCLEAFLKEEPLGPDDMWYCPQCKEHRQATKKLDLWRLPEILVIHLKRFSYNRYLKNKLDSFVNFPIHNLDLSKYIGTKASHIYELYAISNHYGGLGGGHYSAYAKLVNDSTWYHFDDSHVSPIGEDDIVTSGGYVLFYRRVNVAEAETQSADGSCRVREAQ